MLYEVITSAAEEVVSWGVSEERVRVLPHSIDVDRFADNAGPEVAKVAALADDLTETEGILIYPEGTRFSAERRLRALERIADVVSRAELDRMRAWTHLLPPRLGGPLALLARNPGRDLVFCAHTGFEGASHFKSLINGAWVGAHIRVITSYSIHYTKLYEGAYMALTGCR